MIKAVVFDLDNTLVDFMAMKRQAVDAAITAMIDAGLNMTVASIKGEIDRIYQEQGIEYQRVFDTLLQASLGRIDYKVLSAGIVAYRRARDARARAHRTCRHAALPERQNTHVHSRIPHDLHVPSYRRIAGAPHRRAVLRRRSARAGPELR